MRRTKAQVEQLERQILDVLTLDHPQSVRHVFYRMTDPTLGEPVEKSENGYRHVQARLKAMRRAGTVPYGWISDMTRRGWHVSTFASAGDFLDRMHGFYRGDLWAGSDVHVEVWTESRSLAGVLEDECDRLAVSLYPAGGFSSLTLCYEAAQAMNRLRDKRRAVVLYAGDYDPAGVLIDQQIEAELSMHSRLDIDFRRLAVNREQIEECDLPTKPRKDTDRRRRDISETVEGEAMPAGVLRQIVRDAVESYLPSNALHAVQVAEESERGGLALLADHLREHGIDGVLDAVEQL